MNLMIIMEKIQIKSYHNMGICVQRPLVNFEAPKPTRASSRESFLYNSFTYDPSQTEQDSNFFFFDVPHYCEIQYILRNQQLQKQINPLMIQKHQNKRLKSSLQLAGNIEQHIEEIQIALADFKNSNFSNKIREMERKSLVTSENNFLEQKPKKITHRLEQNKIVEEDKQRFQLNNILNFQIFSVTLNLNDYEVVDNLYFDVFVKNTKVLTVQGNITDNKWKPTTTNQLSLTNVKINFANQIQQQTFFIKILSKLQGDQIIECTIPINKMTFKYVIPVLQTCNIRTQQDKQPLGQLHFKIEYIQYFEEHRSRVINDLLVRKQALEIILSKAKQHNMVALQDKTIILEAVDNQSYVSEALREK